MAGSFPAVAGGFRRITKGPKFVTRVLPFVDGSEQRISVQSDGLLEIEFGFPNVSAAVVVQLNTFLQTQKGSFDSTWDVTIDGTLYSNMALVEDSWREDNIIGNRYSLSFRARQTKA